jgi:nucleobase:cation symporter-1, NCS1 family
MKVEQRSIEYIPIEMRHGAAKSLFNVWFGANMQITAIVTGALAITFGLSLPWAILSIVLGNLIGGIFMAYHSAQGPKLGIPQMIQSRAQFGIIGAILPLVLVILMYVGFFASSAVLGGQALANFSIPTSLAIIIVNIVTFVIAVYGYDLIHAVEKYFSILFAIVFLFVTIYALRMPLQNGNLTFGHVNFGMFLLAVSIFATWQITYAPYVADYSRYLPEDTPISKTFSYTYFGSVIGSIWMMALGALFTASVPKFGDNATGYLSKVWGGHASGLIFVVIVLGVMAANILNLYGGFMSITTTLEPFTRLRGTPKTRITIMFIVGLVGTGIALWGQGNFLENFSNFLLILMYFMIPWTAINLVDFYLVRKGNYNIEAIFDLNGQYGRVNWTAMVTYLLTVFIQVPFMNTTLYEGPIAKALGEADIAWIVGLIFASLVYYYSMRKRISSSNSSAITG